MNLAVYAKYIKGEDEKLFVSLLDALMEETHLQLSLSEEVLGILKRLHHAPCATVRTFAQELPEETEVLLCLGGDGTLLDTLPLVQKRNIGVLGINLGSLGFLSGIGRKDLSLWGKHLLRASYEKESRMVLRLKTDDEEPTIAYPYALNEIGVFKTDVNSLINIEVSVDGDYVNNYYGDGVIFATPTGSTAYSLSCGGPILLPQSNNILITPAASHTLTVRPIVLSGHSKIRVRMKGAGEFKISLDSKIYTFEKPFEFSIEKADFAFVTYRLSQHTFFDNIREKLMWGADSR